MKLDKLREWIQMLGLVAIPIILGITGNEVAKSNATREVDARMVEIAAQVLAGPAGRDHSEDVPAHLYFPPGSDDARRGARGGLPSGPGGWGPVDAENEGGVRLSR